MSSPRIGALFAGYGGLDLAITEVFGGDMAWYSEIDKGALKILAHRFPDVPNVGSVTEADWSQVEPVDILTGGSPCQDLSHAGRRAGMTEGTRSNLWVAMREAIAQLRPGVVVWENVRGAYSAGATSALEFCAGCMGTDRLDSGAVLRALGRVLGDLSDLGYDCRWHGLRAADVGAPHGRFRVFVVATDTTRNQGRLQHGDGSVAAITSGLRRGARGAAVTGEAGGGWASADVAGRGLLPTPRATDGTKGGPNQRGSSGDLMLPSAVAQLLPTPTTRDHKDHTIRREPHRPDDVDTLARALTDVPCALLPASAVNDMGRAYTPETWDAWTEKMKSEHGNGNGHGKSLEIEAQRLLPTPTGGDSVGTGYATEWDELTDADGRHRLRDAANLHATHQGWGDYAPAIHRWEAILGRPAPAPTMTSAKGNPQLSPRFVEWMMGLPAGWVTDVPGITRNEALKALGNGVVPQQAAAALRTMLAWDVAA